MVGDAMHYIKAEMQHELEISKSKFIAVLMPIEDKDELKSLIASLKIRFAKANHYTYAAIIGHRGEVQLASDDGEPQKTAGVPILEVLKHHQLVNVLCVVIRYFGGIKLGAGGLIRAYAKSASAVILKQTLYERKSYESYEICFKYHFIDTIDHFFDGKASVIKKQFLEDVTYRLVFDQSEALILNDIKHLLKVARPLDVVMHYVPIDSDID